MEIGTSSIGGRNGELLGLGWRATKGQRSGTRALSKRRADLGSVVAVLFEARTQFLRPRREALDPIEFALVQLWRLFTEPTELSEPATLRAL